MSELKAQKAYPPKTRPGKGSQGAGTPPKGGDGSRLYGGSVDERNRSVKPGQPYTGGA